ncbi:MAG: hypothetical protein MZW92_72655 [Comamonadaceae bacterium]|nr:hypothetical protein [Comamonadaceae bacterium]
MPRPLRFPGRRGARGLRSARTMCPSEDERDFRAAHRRGSTVPGANSGPFPTEQAGSIKIITVEPGGIAFPPVSRTAGRSSGSPWTRDWR